MFKQTKELGRHAMLTAVLLGSAALLGGCAATSLALQKHSLDVQTQMSQTVFLTPSSDKTVYLEVRNTTDRPTFQVGQQLRQMLQGRGFTLVQEPDGAHYMLQVNVLQVGKADPSASMATLTGAFGAPLDGFVSGVATAAALSGNVTGHQLAVGGAVAGAADFLSANLVKDVVFTAVTDVQVSERDGANGGAWKQHQTRVVSLAEKVNLDFAEAEPELVAGLANSIGGML